MSKIDMIIERIKVAPPEVVEQIYALMEKIDTTTTQSSFDNPKPASDDLIGALEGQSRHSKVTLSKSSGRCAMSGIEFLLDTNFVIGLLLERSPSVELKRRLRCTDGRQQHQPDQQDRAVWAMQI